MDCRVTIVVWCPRIVCMLWAVIIIIGNKIITETTISPSMHVNSSRQQGSTLLIQTRTIVTITTCHFVRMGRHKELTASTI